MHTQVPQTYTYTFSPALIQELAMSRRRPINYRLATMVSGIITFVFALFAVTCFCNEALDGIFLPVTALALFAATATIGFSFGWERQKQNNNPS